MQSTIAASVQSVSGIRHVTEKLVITIDQPDPTFVFHQRKVMVNAENEPISNVSETPCAMVRSLSSVVTESMTLVSGKVITIEEFIEAIDIFHDRWTKEDAKAGG